MTTGRNAAGRFAAARAEVPKARGTADRRVEAERGIKQLEAQRDSLTAQWRQGLLDDDESAVERCERQLGIVERALRRRHALIELLGRAGPQVVQQHQGWTWPTTLADAQTELLKVEPEIVRMSAVPRVDRSAAFDAHLDFLTKRQYSLTKLIMNLQSSDAA
jgi:hypothetical protein